MPIRFQPNANSASILLSSTPSLSLDALLGSTPGLFAVRGADAWEQRAIVGDDLPNPSTTTLGGVFSLPVTSNSVLSGIASDGTPTRATTTGTGDVVRATSPTITTPTFSTSASVSGTLTITSSSASALMVGRQGITNPALQIDASAANSATGLAIVAQSAASAALNVSVLSSAADAVLTVDAKGTGTINFGLTSTGAIDNWRAVMIRVSTTYFGSTSGSTVLKASAVAGSTTLTLPASTDTLVGRITHAREYVSISAVNFNSSNTDNTITLPAPPTGFTRYSLRSVFISGASASLASSTCGVFTATAAGGTALVASGTATTVTATADSTINNMQVLSPVNVNTMSNLYSALTSGQIYFRVQTASAVAATANVTVEIQWLP